MEFRRPGAMLRSSMQEVRSSFMATLQRLSPERRRLLLVAAATLSAASAAVALLPFKRAVAFGSVGLRPRRPISVNDCVWTVQAVAKRLPWRTMCIEQGLAAQRMLRRTGVNALLHYGARQDPSSGKLEAHVWVSVAGETIIGDQDEPGFAEIATYP